MLVRDKIKAIMDLHDLGKADMLRMFMLSDGTWRNVMRKGNYRVVMWQRAFLEGYELGKKKSDADAS
ncbi:MAG: hypothetical protein AB8G11_09650 [Saprospiraceae bacterium]